MLVDTAAFNFSQDLVANGGPITWIVWSTIPPQSTAAWTSDQTTAPHSSTLTIQTDKYTPSGVYPIGVEVQSSQMCESGPLTTTVYVNATSQVPPPPSADQVEQSPLLGQTATYNFQDAATADGGPLDWTVTINDKEQPPNSHRQRQGDRNLEDRSSRERFPHCRCSMEGPISETAIRVMA